MYSKERVLAAINGEQPDRIPSCFSLHFPKSVQTEDDIVKTHLDFFEKTGCDISKIMNEQLVPAAGELNAPDDWEKVQAFDRNTPFMQKQLRIVKRIRELTSSNTFLAATLHGICASAIHPFECLYGYERIRQMLVEHLRANPAPVLAAFERITEGMIDYARACVEAGVDGIYYAALGGEKHYFTDEEFEKYILPYDHRILKAIRAAGGKVILHICKENLSMERYNSYGTLADIVNWGIYETDFSLENGRALFPTCAILGGLANRSGVLVEGSIEALQEAVRRMIQEFGSKKFLLGADCTLPSDIPYERIAAAVRAAAIK